jgi:hypothetical protein
LSEFPTEETGSEHPHPAADQREAKRTSALEKLMGFYAKRVSLQVWKCAWKNDEPRQQDPRKESSRSIVQPVHPVAL